MVEEEGPARSGVQVRSSKKSARSTGTNCCLRGCGEGDRRRFRKEEEEELFECQNCGDLWTEKELNEVQDVLQRVAPGEKMPYGECPDCGAVCHKWEK